MKEMLKKIFVWIKENKGTFVSLMACGMIGTFGAAAYKLAYDDSKFTDRTYRINEILDKK